MPTLKGLSCCSKICLDRKAMTELLSQQHAEMGCCKKNPDGFWIELSPAGGV